MSIPRRVERAPWLSERSSTLPMPPTPTPSAPPAIELRVLTGRDVAVARALNAMFGRAFGDEQTYTGRPPSDRDLERLLDHDTFVAIAALDGARVVGGLTGYVLPKLEQARSELYLYDLAVDADYRRRGIATALIGRLRQLAAERAVHVIFVQADLGDEPAIALYTKLGLREDVLHFDIAPVGKPMHGTSDPDSSRRKA
jgi:aminoglycoside 3-N-acetyltransferase I